MTLPPPLQSGRLPQLGALRFIGTDSLSFLQGQISNDTRRLAQGQTLFAAYSSPQGRVLALMHLVPHSSGILAIVPRELLAPTLEGLRKFVLRAKVKIEDAGAANLEVAGQHGTEQLQSAGIGIPESSAGFRETDGLGVAAVNGDPTRYWVIGSTEQLAARALDGAACATDRIEHDWRLADIRAGLPQIYASTREAFVAQMLNLDLLDGISFSKGCYTGQEIIARTQHLGRIKRRLYRLQLPDGDWHIGQSVQLADGRAGRLIETARGGDGFEALAVLTVDAGKVDASKPATDAGTQDAGSAAAVVAAELPLPYPM
jgi:folate-binding protein YgfZ